MVKALNLGRSPAQRIPAVVGMVFLAGAALLATTPAQAGRSCESRPAHSTSTPRSWARPSSPSSRSSQIRRPG